jgi:hypothetical protein
MIEPHDIMDTAEVAERFGVSMSSIQVALAAPHRHPTLAARLPAPFRKIGRSWVWRRVDIESIINTQGEAS